jgi:hypothetical protein
VKLLQLNFLLADEQGVHSAPSTTTKSRVNQWESGETARERRVATA